MGIRQMKNRIKKFLAGLGIISAATLGGKTFQKPTMQAPPADLNPVTVTQETLLSEPSGYYLGSVTNQDGSDITGDEMQLAQDSLLKVQQVTKSDCYKESTLSFNFTETKGLSNATIYKEFVNQPLTINIQFFYGTWAQNHWYRTMGYDIGDGVVYANTYFIETPDDLGSLDLHETAHKLKFSHSSPADYSSVPYGQNTLFDKCNGKR